jgi:hypothetical protein
VQKVIVTTRSWYVRYELIFLPKRIVQNSIKNPAKKMIERATDKENFCLELDHISIFDVDNLSSVFLLQNLGLYCSERVLERRSQGTISTVFFFENMYLELVHLADRDMAQSFESEKGINILTRAHWRQTGASPFGIGLRSNPIFIPSKSNTHNLEPANHTNFSTENVAIIEEPLCFSIPHNLALTTWLDPCNISHKQLTSHSLGIKKLTNATMTITTSKNLTNAVALLEDNKAIAIKQGSSPLLELQFDRAVRGEIIDVRPVLPMIISY